MPGGSGSSFAFEFLESLIALAFEFAIAGLDIVPRPQLPWLQRSLSMCLLYSRYSLCWIAVLDSSASACSITAAAATAMTELNCSHLSLTLSTSLVPPERSLPPKKKKEIT